MNIPEKSLTAAEANQLKNWVKLCKIAVFTYVQREPFWT